MAKYIVLPVIVLSDEQLEAVETAQQIGIDYEGEITECAIKNYWFFTRDVVIFESRLDEGHAVVNYAGELHVINRTVQEVVDLFATLD